MKVKTIMFRVVSIAVIMVLAYFVFVPDQDNRRRTRTSFLIGLQTYLNEYYRENNAIPSNKDFNKIMGNNKEIKAYFRSYNISYRYNSKGFAELSSDNIWHLIVFDKTEQELIKIKVIPRPEKAPIKPRKAKTTANKNSMLPFASNIKEPNFNCVEIYIKKANALPLWAKLPNEKLKQSKN